MKDLTGVELEILKGKIKSFLNITWSDVDTDIEVADMATSSVSYLNRVAGIELDYFVTPRIVSQDTSTQNIYVDMCHQGEELIKNRCHYFREKALEDFGKNYQADLNNLLLHGAILKSKLK